MIRRSRFGYSSAMRCARLLLVGSISFLGQLAVITEHNFSIALVRGALYADIEKFLDVLRLCQARFELEAVKRKLVVEKSLSFFCNKFGRAVSII